MTVKTRCVGGEVSDACWILTLGVSVSLFSSVGRRFAPLVVALDGLTVLSGLLTKKRFGVGGHLTLLVSFVFVFRFSGFLVFSLVDNGHTWNVINGM